jgi:4-hydroxybenzoate polyprenyltransferase
MSPYLKIIRPLNLIIIAATMYLMRYCVIFSFLSYNNMSLQINDFNFLLLVLATVFIAAGGYVINDYYDVRADMINKDCNSQIVGTTLLLKSAMRYYIILTFTGLILGTWFAINIGNWNFSTLFLLVAGLLWFYSTTYKAMAFVGNLLVSSLIALVPLLVVIFEMIKFKETSADLLKNGEVNYMPIFYFVAGFAAFAFLTTLIREIIKDIEDIEGDKKTKKKTFPIIAGIKTTKYVIYFLIIIEIAALYLVYFKYLQDNYSLYYFTIAIAIPLLISLIKIIKAKETKQFKAVSNLLKLTMITGLGYSFIICIQLS